jgi:hypothetical protein
MMPILSYMQLQSFDFDPKYNLDYTQKGMPSELTRGGLPYYLPIGWYRHALKVDNKYKDDPYWLGSSNGPGQTWNRSDFFRPDRTGRSEFFDRTGPAVTGRSKLLT